MASLINRSNRGFPKLDGGYLLPINTKWPRINIYETLPPWQLTVHVNILLSIIGTFVSIYHEHNINLIKVAQKTFYCFFYCHHFIFYQHLYLSRRIAVYQANVMDAVISKNESVLSIFEIP